MERTNRRNKRNWQRGEILEAAQAGQGKQHGSGTGSVGEGMGTGRAFILCKTGSESSLGSAIVSALCCLREVRRLRS